MQSVHDIKTFYCDCANPQSIADLQSAGLPAFPVKKGPDSIMAGIQLHNSLIKSREHKIFKGFCPFTEDEYSMYAFPELKENAIVQKETPIDANNNLMDATRYVTTMTAQFRKDREEKKKEYIYSVGDSLSINQDLIGIEEKDTPDWYNE
jgi:hypothetical protein